MTVSSMCSGSARTIGSVSGSARAAAASHQAGAGTRQAILPSATTVSTGGAGGGGGTVGRGSATGPPGYADRLAEALRAVAQRGCDAREALIDLAQLLRRRHVVAYEVLLAA